MYTLNNLITQLQTFATQHQQINSFFFASLPGDGQDEAVEYPLLYCEVQDNGSTVTNNQDYFIFDFHVCNQAIIDNRASVLEVMSDMKLVANDVIAYFNCAHEIELPISMTDLVGFSDDDTVGWKFSIKIILCQGLNMCQMPLDGLVPSYTGNDSYAPSGTYSELVTLIDLKRDLISRVTSITTSATPTPNADTTDQYNITALGSAAVFGAPTGTLTDGQKLIIRVKDNGVARALSFNAVYRFSSDLAAPTTTILSKTLYIGFIYNAADSKFDCLAILNNF